MDALTEGAGQLPDGGDGGEAGRRVRGGGVTAGPMPCPPRDMPL